MFQDKDIAIPGNKMNVLSTLRKNNPHFCSKRNSFDLLNREVFKETRLGQSLNSGSAVSTLHIRTPPPTHTHYTIWDDRR